MRKLPMVAAIACMVMPIGAASAAETLANCEDPKGYAFYHHAGLLAKKDAGFTDDKISGGVFSLVRLDDQTHDIRFMDATKRIISSKEDGGLVRVIREGKRDMTFLVLYPGATIELYHFYVDNSGTNRFDLVQNKGGGQPIHKSAILTGTCSVLSPKLFK